MNEILIAYIFTGIGFYFGLCLKNIKAFQYATTADIIRGLLLGLIFWPVGLVVQLIFVLGARR